MIVGRLGKVFIDTFSERLGRNSTAKPSPIMFVNSPIGVECRCIGRIIDELSRVVISVIEPIDCVMPPSIGTINMSRRPI